MLDGSNAGKPLGRVIDVLPAGKGEADGGAPSPLDGRPYSELPDRSRKWPMPLRVAFITGAAAALWGLIFLGFKLI